MVGDQASPLTPGETLTSQTRATIWSVCELWLPMCLPRQQLKKPLVWFAIAKLYLKSMQYQIRAESNITDALNGPQGHVSAKQ